MFCKMCGKKIHDNSKFCPYCGAAVGKLEEPAKEQIQETAKAAKLPDSMEIEWDDQGKTEKEAVEEQKENPEQSENHIDVKKSLDPKWMLLPVVVVAVAAGAWIGLGKKSVSKSGQQGTEYTTEAQAQESTETVEKETKLAIPFAEGFEGETSDGISPEEYILPECDTRVYTKEELSVLSAEELRLARNEIYARHGRMFSAEDLKNYFQSKSWYTPQYEGTEFDAKGDSILNECEIANRNLIVELEDGVTNYENAAQLKAGYAGLDTWGTMRIPGISTAVGLLDDVYELTGWTISEAVEGDEEPEWSYTGDIYISKNAKFEITVYAKDYFGTGDVYEIDYPHKIIDPAEGDSIINIYDLSYHDYISEMEKIKSNLGYSSIWYLYMGVEFDENGIITSGAFQAIAG